MYWRSCKLAAKVLLSFSEATWIKENFAARWKHFNTSKKNLENWRL